MVFLGIQVALKHLRVTANLRHIVLKVLLQNILRTVDPNSLVCVLEVTNKQNKYILSSMFRLPFQAYHKQVANRFGLDILKRFKRNKRIGS